MSTTNKEFNARNGALIGTSNANYLQLLGNTSGNAVQLNALGSDTNISITLNPKGTGTVNIPSGTLAVVSGTANGILYLNGSGVVSSSANLTYNGTNVVTTGSVTAAAFIPSSGTVPTNGLYLPTTNTVGFSTNSTERLRISAGGVISTPDMRLDSHINFDYLSYFSQQQFIENGVTGLVRSVGTDPTFITLNDSTVPFSKVMNFAAYYDGYVSEFIPIQPGDVIYTEVWAYRANGATGTAGLLYLGMEQYDKDKAVINSNSGLSYTVSGVTVPTTGVWTKYSGTYTAPLTHTVYSGSDGGPVRYIRPRLLVNYNNGTITTYVSGVIYRKVNITRDSGDLSINGNLGIGGTTTLSGGTANGVLYLNGSKAVTSGSALTFDGTNLGIGNAPTTYKVEITTSGNNGLKLNAGTAGADQLYFGDTGGVPAVGTLSGSALTFIYGGSEQMRLTSTGLGIGTSSPAFKLDVAGNISLSNGSLQKLYWNNTGNYLNWIECGGTPGANWMRFATGNAEVMRLDTSGNLGIGTSSPTTKLDVLGSGDGELRLRAPSDAALIFSETTANKNWKLKPSAGNFYWQYSATAYNSGYASLMTLDSSGNLGLGTSSPAQRLHVTVASGGYNTTVTNVSNIGGGILVRGDNNGATSRVGLFLQGSDQIGSAIASAREDSGITWKTYLAFYTNNATGGNVQDLQEKMRIDSSGNVGIGTTSPLAKLDSRGNILIGTNANGDNIIGFGNTSALGGSLSGAPSSMYGNSFIVGTSSTGSGAPGYLSFWTTSNGSVYERLRIDSTGNVGIGTSSPAAKLTVTTYSGTGIISTATTGLPLILNNGAVNSNPTLMEFEQQGYSYWRMGVPNASDAFAIYGYGSGTFPERLRIDSSGNVGIGTSSPANGLLTIGTDGSSKGIAVNAGSQTTYGYLSVSHYTNGAFISTYAGSNAASDILRFGTTGTEKARITSGGNVLIGTTTDGGYKLQVNGSFAATTKSFLIDHPTKEGMKLRYGSLESPYHGVRLTGEGVLINGSATIELPEYIKGLCKQEGSQVQITNIKHGKVIWVEDIEVDNNRFTVAAEVNDNKEYKFYWSFTAIRKDIDDMIVEF